MSRPVIAWFRRNLRLTDNPAWFAACETGAPVIALYVSDDLDTGGASRWWLHHSLKSLAEELGKQEVQLIIRRGDPVDVVPAFVSETEAKAIYCSRRFEPRARKQEKHLRDALADDIDRHVYNDYLLRHPRIVKTQSDTPYKVFTPFYRASTERGEPDVPLPAPDEVNAWNGSVDSLPLDELQLRPTKPDWSGGLDASWNPGETGALEQLDAFEARVGEYGDKRDLPAIDGTSRLSPHLHFGEVSPRQVWHAIRLSSDSGLADDRAEPFLRQLYWRDFSWYLIYHFPELPDKPLRREFEEFPWRKDEQALVAWQKGKTGIPIVDAGMRQLWETGWMHNRVRMLVASFLVKNLLIPWQEGRAWFDDTLVDADAGNNSAGWQWVAGCGTDAAPYFRIFNPVTQSRKFDPDGDYIRRWIPELAELQDKVIHDPSAADPALLADAGIELGNDYPEAIADLKATRERALEAFDKVKK